jgi:hypothetical protein
MAHHGAFHRVQSIPPFLLHRLYHSAGELHPYAFPLQGTESNQLGLHNQASFAQDMAVSGGQETQEEFNGYARQAPHGDHAPLAHDLEYHETEWYVSQSVASRVQQDVLSSRIKPLPRAGDIDTSEPMDQGSQISQWVHCFAAVDSAPSSGTSNSSCRSTHSVALSHDCGSEMTD